MKQRIAQQTPEFCIRGPVTFGLPSTSNIDNRFDYSKRKLNNMLFKEFVFKDVNFSQSDLKDTTFQGCEFVNCNFAGASMNNVEFFDCNIDRCSFADVYGKSQTFNNSGFDRCDFARAQMNKLMLIDTTIEHSSFNYTDLRHGKFANSLLTNNTYRWADVSGVESINTNWDIPQS